MMEPVFANLDLSGTAMIPVMILLGAFVLAVLMAFVPAFRRWPGGSRPAPGTAGFVPRPVLNHQEARLYRKVEARLPRGYRLLAQVSYGEMLRCRDQARFLTINARRADFVLVDAGFNVVAVIEYDGPGHTGYTRRTRERAALGDSRKTVALQEAGLTLLRIPADYTPAALDKLLQPLFSDGRPEQ